MYQKVDTDFVGLSRFTLQVDSIIFNELAKTLFLKQA